MLSYKGHRYPVEIINHCVWLYFRFPLSFREVEEMMLERGVVVSLRDDPPVVRQVWAGLRQPAVPTAVQARRQVASRRGLHQNQRHTALLVAGGRPARERARCAGPVAPKRQRRQAILP